MNSQLDQLSDAHQKSMRFRKKYNNLSMIVQLLNLSILSKHSIKLWDLLAYNLFKFWTFSGQTKTRPFSKFQR